MPFYTYKGLEHLWILCMCECMCVDVSVCKCIGEVCEYVPSQWFKFSTLGRKERMKQG